MSKGWAILGLLLAVTFMTTGAFPASGTTIVRFIPAGIGENMKEGHCWTNSIAAPRPDAWRCMAGNEILDPCFLSPEEGSVVCKPNPAKGEEGIHLKLNQPLPKPEISAQAAAMARGSGWLVELADGTLCSPATGTRGLVEGEMTTYYCEVKLPGTDIVLLGELNDKEPQWMAEKATLVPGPDGPKLLRSEKVAVKTVWQ